MTKDNFTKLLTVFLQRKPWRSFTIELVSGALIEVNHPESLTPGEIITVSSTTGLRAYFDFSTVARFIDATGVR